MIRHFSQKPTLSPDSPSPVVQRPLGGSHTHRETECPGHRVFQRPRGGGHRPHRIRRIRRLWATRGARDFGNPCRLQRRASMMPTEYLARIAEAIAEARGTRSALPFEARLNVSPSHS